MRAKFLVALNGLDLPFISGRGDQIRDDLFITTDSQFVGDLIPDWARTAIGELEYEFLTSRPVIHASVEVPDDQAAVATSTLSLLREAHRFVQSLWLHHDNAVCTDTAFLIHPGPHRWVHSNSVAFVAVRADGSTLALELTREALAEIRRVYRDIFRLDGKVTAPTSTLLVQGTTRFDRAFYRVQMARAAHDVLDRISEFCSALEALLATSPGELAHQLAERCAFFVRDTPDDRLKVYREIKKAYGYRSKFVHGDFVKESEVAIVRRLAVVCADVVREALLRVATRESYRAALKSGNQALDDLMLSLIFGVSPNPGDVEPSPSE